VGSENHVLDGSPDSPWEGRRGKFEGERACPARACQTTLCHELCNSGWNDPDAVCVVDSGGPEEACVT